ncbi:response regulator [Nostoc punctiforme]|uniref:Two component transcriptional regulator, AraC family n=1 Tax=Nostoc punctiforme (strain ATCC 29133 / PCC 73102) TaxID=63737 RepID=B2IYR7_NOSP7|nr:response regulator [Nostoc punctiforme]ACC81650.1 two component transcriptional regulator, AraC family [Nostoc punctiforme PCC 73102]
MIKVLIIEDEQLTREMLLDYLESEGFETMSAKNGRIGVQKVHEHRPDLAICDIMMPELDGYGVLKTLHQNPTTAVIPFIFLTGKSNKAEIRQGMALGASDYLIKPFTPEELLGAIAAQLKKQAILKQWFAFESQRISEFTSDQTDEFTNFSLLFSTCPQLKKIFNFIETHYHESISSRDVAKYLGFSSAYLTGLVRNQTGETLNRWIVRRRVTAARDLLLKTDESIQQIAIALGYRSINHFFRQFREYYGTSPQAWRKVNRRHYIFKGRQAS